MPNRRSSTDRGGGFSALALALGAGPGGGASGSTTGGSFSLMFRLVHFSAASVGDIDLVRIRDGDALTVEGFLDGLGEVGADLHEFGR